MNNKSNFGVGVLGTGKYIPDQLLSNEQIEASAGLELGTIIEKTGIEERYVADESETASSMASIAAKKAIITAGINPEEINLII